MDECLFTSLPGDIYEEVGHQMAHARLTSYNNIKERQKKKFAHLMAKHKPSEAKDSNIVPVTDEECANLKS